VGVKTRQAQNCATATASGIGTVEEEKKLFSGVETFATTSCTKVACERSRAKLHPMQQQVTEHVQEPGGLISGNKDTGSLSRLHPLHLPPTTTESLRNKQARSH
jgi:hypothetical protein